MTIFKYSLKMALNKKFIIIFYIVLLIVITLIFGMNEAVDLREKPISIGVVDIDESNFSNSLIGYLDKKNDIHKYKNIEDAEFDYYTGIVDGIVKIPKDSENLLKENKSAVSLYLDYGKEESRLLDNLVRNYSMYYSAMEKSGNLDLNKLEEALNETAKLKFVIDEKGETSGFRGFSISYGLIIMMIIIKILGDMNISFNDKNIRIRNFVSPVSSSQMNLRINLMQILISIVVFIIVVTITILGFYRNVLGLESLKYYLFTLLFWTLIVTTLANLLNKISMDKNFNNITSNTIPLVLSFISGTTIKMEFLPDIVQKFARFSPLYYYNEAIKKIYFEDFNISKEILIMGAFGIVFIVTSLFLDREKKTLY